MIKKIKDIIESAIKEEGPPPSKKMVVLDPAEAAELLGAIPSEPDMRIIGLFTEVSEEKNAELIHALLYLNELNKLAPEESKKRPIEFYVSTYGGSADDMFGMYDMMRQIREETEIHTIGLGKVMSAGVLILASGTKGKRKIGKYCRVMIHSVVAGSHGSLSNLVNEMEAIQKIQEDYIEALVAETDMTKKDIKNMLERKVNVYLSAEEAVELGIADIII
jgi:ATP-dependent Clp protease, protease subunit